MAKLTVKIILTAIAALAFLYCFERGSEIISERAYFKSECSRLTNQNDSLRNANWVLDGRLNPPRKVKVYGVYKPGKIVD